MTMAWFALSAHLFAGDIERGNQGGSSVTNIVVGDALDIVKRHRQRRLGPLQSLDLAFHVDAQHQSVMQWVEVQADGVAHILDEEWIGGKLETLAAVRLQGEIAGNSALGDACLTRDLAHAPVRGLL